MFKNKITRYIVLILSLLASALLLNLLIIKTNIVIGGVNGVSIILNYIYGWRPSLVILCVSIILLILSFMYLGIERTSGTIVATFLYPLLVELTSHLTVYVKIETTDLILVSIFIGVIGGFANGLMYKTGFSNGGLPILSQILYEKLKIPISKSSLVINGTIVFIGGIFFGWNMVMYAIIILYINSFMVDKVILGISDNKAFYIITKHEDLIKDYIIKSLNHGATIFDVKGGFKNRKEKVLLTVIPTREYFQMTEGIKEIDPSAFFLACDAYEVKGGK